MRVLLVCPSWGQVCGVADYTRYLVDGFHAIGVPVQVSNDAAALRQALNSDPYDLIHLQHEYSLYNHHLSSIVKVCADAKIPTFATMHTVTHSPGPAHQHPLLTKACRAIILHSEEARQLLMAGGIPGHQLAIARQGCPTYAHTFANQDVVRAELGIPANAFAVGFFGFAFPQKGIVPLAQAIGQVEGTWGFIQAADHFLVPGYFQQLRRDLGLPPGSVHDRVQAGRVILSNGHLPEQLIGRYMHAMDAIILPYWSPPGVASTSAAVRAAFAAHRPVVTTEASSFSDLQGEVLKIPAGSVESIRSAIEWLRRDPHLRQQLAEKARRYSIRNRWEMVARRHVELYRQRGCGPVIPPHLTAVYNQHPDAIYDLPIQRERVDWVAENVTGRTVELGCANGYLTEYCGALLGVDINEDRLQVARLLRQGISFERRDITQPLPYLDNAFDTVLLPEVLPRIPLDLVLNVVDEAVRIGRRVVITMPNSGKPDYDRALVENPEHLWLATPENVQRLLDSILAAAAPGASIKVETSGGQEFIYAVIQRD